MLYLFLADGFEEVEALAPVDLLRRAEISVQTVGVTGKNVTGSHGVTVTADILPEQMEKAETDGVILPGGMPGTLNLQKSEAVTEMLHYCAENKKLIAAICAAPMVLGEMGILNGKKAVCFPGFEEHLEGAVLTDEPVQRDGNIITARGAGVAWQLGAAIVDYFCDGTSREGKGEKLLSQIQMP